MHKLLLIDLFSLSKFSFPHHCRISIKLKILEHPNMFSVTWMAMGVINKL